MSPLTLLYLAFSQVADPVWRLVHRRRLKKGKEDPSRITEKYGVSPYPLPSGKVLWFHALSVGESLALLPLIDRALDEDPNTNVVITTSTATSIAALAKAGLPDRAKHVLLPIDTPRAVRRFLDHWRPEVAVFAELDFWPRLMFETHQRGIPMILVNSRMSPTSFESRRKLRGMMGDILGFFDKLLVQDPESADRFKRLGAVPDRVDVVGALKSAARPLPADPEEMADLRQRITNRPVWLAAATRDIEEPEMIRAHLEIKKACPNALLIIAPRFLESADDIEAAASKVFNNVSRRSRAKLPDVNTDVFIADTIGEMGLWYRIAPVSFVGHSLGPEGKPLGGKNPYEAAALGSVIVFGPSVADFSETYQMLQENSAAVPVSVEGDLSECILKLFDDGERTPIIEAANRVIKTQSGVLETTWATISNAN